jgi:glycerol uptake facilitator protein
MIRAEGLVIGFFVFVVILGLGGPTGIAANPARDLSPRIAHALLPIPGEPQRKFCDLCCPCPLSPSFHPLTSFINFCRSFPVFLIGKGPSEFYYSWIPVLAPLCGGCASAGFYAAVQLLNNSNVPGNDIFPAAAVTG